MNKILSQGGGDIETSSFSHSSGGNHEGDTHSCNDDDDDGGYAHSATTRSESAFYNSQEVPSKLLLTKSFYDNGGRLGTPSPKKEPNDHLSVTKGSRQS